MLLGEEVVVRAVEHSIRPQVRERHVAQRALGLLQRPIQDAIDAERVVAPADEGRLLRLDRAVADGAHDALILAVAIARRGRRRGCLDRGRLRRGRSLGGAHRDRRPRRGRGRGETRRRRARHIRRARPECALPPRRKPQAVGALILIQAVEEPRWARVKGAGAPAAAAPGRAALAEPHVRQVRGQRARHGDRLRAAREARPVRHTSTAHVASAAADANACRQVQADARAGAPRFLVSTVRALGGVQGATRDRWRRRAQLLVQCEDFVIPACCCRRSW